MSKKKKTIIIISIVMAVILLGFSTVKIIEAKYLNHVKIDKSDEALGISDANKLIKTVAIKETEEETEAPTEKPTQKVKETEPAEPTEEEILKKVPERDDIVTFALFGVDSRTPGSFKGRSDCIMLATVDFGRKDIKLMSLMRDMKVKVEGRGWDKLNHAYSFGGPQLAIKTINQNFGLDVRDYATVDFFTLANIIDIVGGVEIDISEAERKSINGNMREVSKIRNEEVPVIENAGKQRLNGTQAVGYARVRNVGNSDFGRVSRQRTVLAQMIKEVNNMGVKAVPGLITDVLPNVETSLDVETILTLGLSYFKAGGNFTIQSQTFPVQGYFWDDRQPKKWMLGVDLDGTSKQIQDFIYKDIKPTKK